MVEVKKEGVLLEKTDREFENQAVLNPGCVRVGDKVKMLYRAVKEGNYSSLGYCELDGPLVVSERYENPVMVPEFDYERHGIEDPRIVFFEGKYYVFYTAYDGKNARTAYATSDDMVSFEKKGIISANMLYGEAEDLFRNSGLYLKERYFFFESYYKDVVGEDVLLWAKDSCIFPKRIGGRIALMHRILPDMQISYANDLCEYTAEYWKAYLKRLSDHLLLKSKFWYESRSIGGGAPPIETKDGWLIIYHAVEDSDEGKVYHASAALLDKDNPQKVIGHLRDPLFSPQMDWELKGDVNNVVFPSGAVEFDGRLYIYYGAADKRIGVASLDLDELLDDLLCSEGYPHIISEIGHTASQVLSVNRKKTLRVSELAKMLEKEEKLILLALGWLAREGKVDYLKLDDDLTFKVK
jgi:predicted GH43/DUF377 family glycosyl hydrolase